LYLFRIRMRKQTAVIIEAITSVNYIQNLIQHPGVKLTRSAEEIIGDHHVDFEATGRLMTI